MMICIIRIHNQIKRLIKVALNIGSRETAFVQALTAASVMMEIAKACVREKTSYCGCGRLGRRDRQDVSILDGCGDNINFGAYLTANFMDPKRVRSHAKKTKRHNHIAGRKVKHGISFVFQLSMVPFCVGYDSVGYISTFLIAKYTHP